MQLLPFQVFLYTTLLALLASTSLSEAKPNNAILLSKVKSLTLRENAKTSHRRVPAVPQLTCVGPGCKHYKVDVMRCTNQGSEYSSEDIQWSCTTNLPEEFKLGSTDVVCEGYDSKDDDYVLKGSCAVEYRLLLTDVGQEKYGKSHWDGGSEGVEKGLGLLFWLLFIGVVIWILYSMGQGYEQGANGQRRQPGGGWGGGWGGGGGGGGPDDPYDPPPPYPGTGKRSTKSYGATDQSWRPGFWSGAAAGAAGGYFAGSRANRQQNQGGSSWGGSGSGGSGWGAGPSSGGSSSPSSGSSNSRSATGFGSTSRR